MTPEWWSGSALPSTRLMARDAFKVTRPLDVVLAGPDRASEDAVTSQMRVGIGTDVHAFAEGGAMWLAGLVWEDQDGLEGHSDADVASHAICDAVLSAAGLGDLGSLVGTNDPEWSDASGVSLVAHAAAAVRGSGFAIVNVSVQVIGNRPRVGEQRREAQDVLSAALGAR